MLISHTRKFIYLKTHKTASTSIEGYLERFCAPPGHMPEHSQAEIKSEYGYIAGRAGQDFKGNFLRAHSEANLVRTTLGPDTFDRYLKVYAVRNPFDKVVSWFWFVMPPEIHEDVKDDFDKTRALFSAWLQMRPKLPVDAAYYRTKKGIFPAFRIYYETLAEDMAALLRQIGAPQDEATTLPDWKSEYRFHRDRTFHDYYGGNPALADIVLEAYRFDFRHFGYDPESWRHDHFPGKEAPGSLKPDDIPSPRD